MMGFFGFYIDPTYLLIFFITLVISIAAQVFMSSTYKKWNQVRNGPDLSGTEAGYAIVNRTGLGGGQPVAVQTMETAELRKLAELRDQGLVTEEEFQAKKSSLNLPKVSDTRVNTSQIEFQRVGGNLTDHYDPRSHTVRLSNGVASRHSVAAMAIVAHELGHAQQHEHNSFLITMRNFLVPAVSLSPQIAYFLIIIGLIFNLAGAFWLGVIFYGLMVLFSIVTLPVEFDASRRGRKLLREAGLMVSKQDEQGSQRVLMAAASTYVAAAVTAILQLLYYISIGRRRS
jgi:Zn-dependent membrane protease YugP